MHIHFKKNIDDNFSFLSGKKLLIAISGGVDSVVLTMLLKRFNHTIALAHCNFRLRGIASDKDENFVKKLATNIGIEFFTTSFDTKVYAKENSVSIQMAARELRYHWFEAIREKNKFDYILTAHHADDNLETFLINLTRGTGMEGLTGIPNTNKYIIRPLLPFSREEIENYAKQNKITWREDLSNTETKYLRNKLRHDIIPLLKEINPNLLSSFNKTTSHLQESDQIIKDHIYQIQKDIITQFDGFSKLNIAKIKALSNPKAYLFELLKNENFTEWNDITQLLDAQSGKKIFSKTHCLLKNREFLILTKRVFKTNNIDCYQISSGDCKIHINKNTIITQTIYNTENILFNKNKQIAYIDKTLLKFPLTVRKWQNGDYFYPLGMQGKKKLSKYFKDQKLSLFEKENTWVIYSENKVVWIVNHRQDDRFKVVSSSKNILKIEIV